MGKEGKVRGSDRTGYRIAIGASFFEGNSLSPVRTTLTAFQSKCYEVGDALLTEMGSTSSEIAGALSVLAVRGDVPVPLLAAYGGAGGRVTAETWRTICEGMLDRLRHAGAVDGVYLALHGSMLCEGTDDPDGDLLQQVRGIVGKVPIAVSCDMHGHITRKMLAHADILIGYQLYPHDDTPETGQRATGLLLRMLDGAITPVMSHCKVPSIVQSQRQRTRGGTPMAKLYRTARALEASGRVLSASYFPVQPWMDVAELGFTAVAIADGDPAQADAVAEQIAREYWDLREEFRVPLWSTDDAIRAGLAVQGGPVLLVDAADCTGGGASGDSVIVLSRVLALAPEATATVLVVDPEVAAAAHAAGERRRIPVVLGNKLDPCYGQPLTAEAEILRLIDGSFTYSAGVFGGQKASMGQAAWLRIGAADVLVASLSSYEYMGEQFAAAGIAANECKFVIVKNPMNYQQAYENAVASYILDTPGPTTPALDGIAIPRAGRPFYPFDIDFEPEFQPVRKDNTSLSM